MRFAAVVILFALGLSVLLYLAAADRTQAQVHLTPTPRPSSVIDLSPDAGAVLTETAYPKLDGHLNVLISQVQAGLLTAQVVAANAPMSVGASVAVTLYFEEGNGPTVLQYLNDNGADPRSVAAEFIEAYVPVTLLGSLSELPEIDSVTTITPPREAQTGQGTGGVAAHRVAPWHSAGYKGNGTKIGIIDTGFDGFNPSLPSLPSGVASRCYTSLGRFSTQLRDCMNGSNHGTSVTEAIFAIAPNAEYFISNPRSYADLRETVDWMADQGIHVINMSLFWGWVGPGDGTSSYPGTALNTVDDAVDRGILWANSAGNAAMSNWRGSLVDSDNDGWHNFDGQDECNTFVVGPHTTRIQARLRWDDSWGDGPTSANLSLQLFDSSYSPPRLVSPFIFVPVSTSRPAKLVDIPVSVSSDKSYCVAVRQHSGSAPNWIQVEVLRHNLDQYTPAYSIGTPSDSANPGMLAVGAANWNTPNTIEPFSSHGPTTDGRTKPDIVGADGVFSAVMGADFYGTSQASPHVAGLAALVRQKFPNYSPIQIAQFLKGYAAARGRVPNNTWGYGFSELPNPQSIPTPTPTSEPTPTATPLLPTPTSTPTATPSPTATTTPPPDPCVEAIESDNSWEGTWDSGCLSMNRDGSYAHYYTFTLTDSADVSVTLESTVDPYLFLLEGAGREGVMLYENDDIEAGSNTNSRITQALPTGSYTIEATTYSSGETGEFTLTVTGLQVEGPPTPTPTQTPAPTPEPTVTPGPTPEPTPVPPGGIAQYGCTADDLEGVVESYTQQGTEGPGASGEPAHHGIQEVYSTTWVNEGSGVKIECRAVRYDSLGNARWTGLNYSAVLDRLSVDLNIGDHAQIFASTKGDGGLSYWLQYSDPADETYLVIDVRFLDLANLTVVQVSQIYIGDEEYIGTDTDEVDGVARRIWERLAGRN